MATGLAILVVAVGGGIGYSHILENRAALAAFRALPASERNLAVFDAACDFLEQRYFNRELIDSADWPRYKALWRAKAAAEQPGFLYDNVLNNFAAAFPDSHVAFAPPAHREALVMEMSPEMQARASALPPISEQERAERHALLAERVQAFFSSPGFFWPRIRRGEFGEMLVDRVIRASAAERAGISPGWVMTYMNRRLTNDSATFTGKFLDLGPEGLRQFEKTGMFPGTETREQRLAYIEANAFTVEFELSVTEPASDFETRQFPAGVTYLRFDGFTPSWLLGGGLAAKAMDVIDSAGPGGLILDLRYNHGGRSLEMARIGGRLLGDDTVLGYSRHADGTLFIEDGMLLGDHYHGPLVVLIGPSTTSAGEVIAAAVQDHKRGKLIGRATNGSAVVGHKFDLPDGGKMMVPVQDFLRIDERRIDGVGVEPDIWIVPTLEDVRAGRDPVLERALQEIGATI